MADAAPVTGGAPTTPAAGAAPVGSTGGTGNPNPTQSGGTEWYSSFNPELKGYAELKQFKTPESVVDAYRNLEKLIGVKDQLLTVPQKDDDLAGWGEVYKRIGKPEKPENYKINVPKEIENKEFSEWAQKAFHEANLTSKQAEAFVNKWVERVRGEQTRAAEAQSLKAKEQEAALKKEWGMAYEQNVQIAKRAMTGLELGADQIDALDAALGHDKTMKLLQTIGSKLGEDSFVSASSSGAKFGAMTPDAARSRIAALRGDKEFVDRYVKGDVNARSEMEKLHQFAYPS